MTEINLSDIKLSTGMLIALNLKNSHFIEFLS